MASNSTISLKSAANAVNGALERLEAAVEIVAIERATAAQAREQIQAEISESWKEKCGALENEIAQWRAENAFLKEETKRLSNQLQHLQREHVELQRTASSTVSRLSASVSQLDLLLEHSA